MLQLDSALSPYKSAGLPLAALALALLATPDLALGQTTTPASQTPTASTAPPRRATQLIGASALNDRRETIGQVEDLLVPSRLCQMVAMISIDGFLGMGTHFVSVPFSEIAWNEQRGEWSLPRATKEAPHARPVFTHAERSR